MALRKLLAPGALTALVILAGCGGGGGSAGSGQAVPDAQDPLPAAAPPVIAAAVAPSDAIEIDGFELVSTTRVSRTVFDYTYTAEAGNWGEADATVSATVTSTAAGTTVVDGSLGFGDIPVGATVLSTDTFTIRQDRTLPFDNKALKWTVQATPLPPTTTALIAQALADGLIDAETALVYRVYAEMGDDRLPVQYRGRADGQFDAVALGDAEVRFSTLSPATQQILAPFLASPDVSGVTPEPAPETLAAQAAEVVSPLALTPAAAPNWRAIWIVNQEVAVYWDDTFPLDAYGEQVANAIAAEVRARIWPKLTSLYGHPAANRFVKIFVDTGAAATSHATSEICTTNPEVHIAPQHHGLKYVWAHELAHALLYYRFPALVSGCNQSEEYRWMHEATAKWSEHFVYPTTMNNREHEVAPNFLDEPALPLEYFGDNHQYGAYLWFFYITKGKTLATDADVQRVVRTWDATATTSSLAAVNAGVSDIGGLKEQWPEFALFNWNRVPHTEKPYRKYFQWDKLRHRARESTTAVDPGGFQAPKVVKLDGKIYKGTALPHLINHLGAKYWHFDFTEDPTIRRVRLIQPYSAGPPTTKVQAIVKVTGKDWEPAEDWTGYERKTLCRDKQGRDGQPNEDVEELVIIISDSEFIDRSHVLDDSGASGGQFKTFVEVSALGCTNWTGEVDFGATLNNDGLQMTETGQATNLRWEIDVDRFSLQTYKLTRGTVHWKHQGTDIHDDGDSCAGESEGTYDLAGSTTAQAFAVFSAVGDSVPPLVPLYNMFGARFGVDGPADYTCHDAQDPFEDYPESPAYGTHDVWLDFGFGPTGRFVNKNSPSIYESLDPGNLLTGSAIVRDTFFGPKTRTYGWTFRKDPDPATRFTGFSGEPEL